MTFPTRKAAAVAAASALLLAGLPGVAAAQTGGGTGSLDGPGSGDTGLNLGSIIIPLANATGVGSFDTTGSLIGEPTTGSLAGSAAAVSDSVNVSAPGPGTGSVDTTGSIIGEPTTGSLAPVYAPIAGSLGIGAGETTIIGSAAPFLSGDLGSVLLVGSSIAAISAGIYFAPQIQQALDSAGISLPGLPPMAPPPAPAPAPGPPADNGRG